MFRRYRNFLQAASLGAVQAVPIATSTLANQIAFVSLLAFLNAMLKWFGGRVGINFLTFKVTLADGIPCMCNFVILLLMVKRQAGLPSFFMSYEYMHSSSFSSVIGWCSACPVIQLFDHIELDRHFECNECSLKLPYPRGGQ